MLLPVTFYGILVSNFPKLDARKDFFARRS
jgi:hypothetical protein